MRSARITLVTLVALTARPVASQEEGRSFSERFLWGGEIVGNLSAEDPGYFNAVEYRRNLLRLVRLSLALELQVSDALSVLSEIRTDNFDVPEPYALYVRFRPWRERAFDIQAGRVPPVFGQFARRRYDSENPLIGYPLTYQYPTTARADAAPAELAQVLYQRGYGARVVYPIGNQEPMAGLPMVNPLRWDTGVQLVIGDDPVVLALALTQGTISNPRVRDDNSGKQLAARLGLRPAFGWVLGISGARGDYVSDEVGAITGEDGDQTALGIDLEIARGHWSVRAEAMWSEWDTPSLDVPPLGGLGFYVEASYKISPGLFVATRFDRIRYDELDRLGGVTWDSSITRIELGVGYYFHRHVLAKLAYQYNERDAGPVTVRGVPAVQLLFWF